MKRNLLTLAAAAAIALGGFAIVQAQDKQGFGGQGWHGRGHGNMFKHMTETLNLTPDQQAKVQPIIDQAKPQLKAIHQEAMQKSKAVMESTMTQIRPLLNADQQKKLDDIKAAHQQMRDAMQKMHAAQTE